MPRTIFCTYLQKKAEGLPFEIIPGDIGKRIYDNISQEAWDEWQKKQTMFINEHKLNLLNHDDRQKIQTAMVGYLFEGRDIKIKGYTETK